MLALAPTVEHERGVSDDTVDVDAIFDSVHSVPHEAKDISADEEDDEIFDVDENEESEGSDEDDTDAADDVADSEEISDDADDSEEDEDRIDTDEKKDENRLDDITAKLKSMFGETEDTEEEESAEEENEDHSDISAMILKMLSEDFSSPEPKKDEPAEDNTYGQDDTDEPEDADESEDNDETEDPEEEDTDAAASDPEDEETEEISSDTDTEESEAEYEEEEKEEAKEEEPVPVQKPSYRTPETPAPQKPNAEFIDLPDYDGEEVDLFADADEQESLYEADRKQVKYAQAPDAYEKKEDIKSIKDSLARIKNKRKGI